MALLSAPRFIPRNLASGYSIDKPREVIGKMRGDALDAVLENPKRHNAAVVLASPDYAKHLDDPDFNSQLVNLLSASANTKDFHLLCAIVDTVAPSYDQFYPEPGISVLRGELDSLLPQLWQLDAPVQKVERDSVAALTFKVGQSFIQTLPLAQTTFLNNKASTLSISRYDSSRGSLKLQQKTEKQWQQVHIQVGPFNRSDSYFELWAPLSPVTRARKITASFGNIVRGIEVDGKSIPASTELEAAVNSIFEHRRTATSTTGPMGVWALVTPEYSPLSAWTADNAPDPSAMLEGNAATRDDVDSCARYLERQYYAGSRFYQVLSGGGGWGPKKGLLSLDPRENHFALSEEEEMKKFVRTMSNSSFAPPGAHIQFFVPPMGSVETVIENAKGIVFGVPWNPEATSAFLEEGYLIRDHFGALSAQGIYSSFRQHPGTSSYYDSKLSVPGSRLYYVHD
ncbi:hypothetical protein E4U42_003333 [Claviceps africana]|uniref:Uncharacterized protein n=1 Tax=Claviceps africana TaxID=83212 RepID=A0A8K0NGX0_9HYPO|nr:hypothetical protein E4U42_003333 [Claviceps africana]